MSELDRDQDPDCRDPMIGRIGGDPYVVRPQLGPWLGKRYAHRAGGRTGGRDGVRLGSLVRSPSSSSGAGAS